MLAESRIFRFLDNTNQFTIAFIEGQKIVQDLALIHNLQRDNFSFIRTATLSTIPMLSFLKPSEGLGLYIDNEEPYFRFKLEAHSSGSLRTLFLPEHDLKVPEKMKGISRFTKILPKSPYTSVVEINGKSFDELINEILSVSYQMKAKILVSDDSDQSILFAKLPDPNQNFSKDEDGKKSLNEYQVKMAHYFNEIFRKALNDQESVQKTFEELGLIYLGNNVCKFHCPCSEERMVANLITLSETDLNDIFKDGPAEVKCDYCKKKYQITRDKLIAQ